MRYIVHRHTVAGRFRAPGLRAFGLCLLVAFVVSALFVGPLGVFGYLAGFFNLGPVHALFLGLGVWPLVLALAVWNLVVACRRRRRRRNAILWMLLVVGAALSFAWQFTGMTAAPIGPYARGFDHHLRIRADMEAIQAWVEALDTSGDRRATSGSPGERMDGPEQMAEIVLLNAKARIEPDEWGRARLRLTWHGSRPGAWGVVVGRRDMETPQSDLSLDGEVICPLRKGVYFWSR